MIQYKSFDDDCVGAFPFRPCKLSIWKVFWEYSSRLLPPKLKDSELSYFETATSFGNSSNWRVQKQKLAKYEQSGWKPVLPFIRFTRYHSLSIAMHCQLYLQQKSATCCQQIGILKTCLHSIWIVSTYYICFEYPKLLKIYRKFSITFIEHDKVYEFDYNITTNGKDKSHSDIMLNILVSL